MGVPEDRLLVDPFGAPEVFCTGAVFELAAPGVVRVSMIAKEDGQNIVKVKLLIPLASLPGCIANATLFAAGRVSLAVIGGDGGQPKRLM